MQDSVTLSEQLNLNRFDPDYYPLQLGNHVLGGGFYATRLYHDLRQVAGYVYTVDVSLDCIGEQGHLFRRLWLQSGKCLKGESADSARSGTDADSGRLSRRASTG